MTSPSKVPVAARYVLGLLLVLGITLAIFVLLLRPAAVDFGLMTLFLLITAFITFVVGYTAYKLGWLNFTPTLRWALIASYALSSMLTFINVWLTARLMFASRHDLMLATVLLIFAGGMAMILGVFLASALTDRIRLLEAASRKLAEGDLSARVPVQGRDEIATLTAAFNEMASQLQAIDQKQHELENLRSDLIAWIGHDLQTPLSSIRAILEA
ncbi:MAG: putative two-component histidine kinase, partial [Chloroflexi bacterium]|nr:putative two-component histidine kinase [Chloroflexota bacterium]